MADATITVVDAQYRRNQNPNAAPWARWEWRPAKCDPECPWSPFGIDSMARDVLDALAAEQAARAAAEQRAVTLWECPACLFRFDAAHTDPDGGHSCPVCAQVAAEQRAEAAERDRDTWREQAFRLGALPPGAMWVPLHVTGIYPMCGFTGPIATPEPPRG